VLTERSRPCKLKDLSMNHNQVTNKESIARAVLGSIIFLDLFDYPLTTYEVWYYLDKKFTLTDVVSVLDYLTLEKKLDKKNGFYFLPGREVIIDIRQRRFNYACSKIKKAKAFTKLFSFFPFIKLVAVANFIGAYNLRQGSDIDFFIITSPNRIWLSRLVSAGLAKILKLRPTGQQKKDKICLSFYVSESSLNLKKLELENGDPYFYYWLRGLRPIHNKKNTWFNFLQANNLVLDKIFKESNEAEQKNSLLINIKSKCNQLGMFLEKIAKKIQLKIMAEPLRLAMNNSDGVVVSDQILKLYLIDNRREFVKKFNLKINEVFAKNN